MKEWVFSRWKLFKKITIQNAQIDLAYKNNFIFNLMSTFFYTFVYILLIEVIYTNTDELIGYTEDEMKFFFFVGQWQAFINFGLLKGFSRLADDVHKGDLDTKLTKPFPTLFYYHLGFINPIDWLRTSVPPLTFIALTINWGNLSFTNENVFLGTLIFITGYFIVQNILMMIAMVSFYLNKTSELFGLSHEIIFSVNSTVPYDLFPNIFQRIFTFIIPVGFISGISTLVFLNKADGIDFLIASIIFAVVVETLKRFLWSQSIEKYSSASS